MEEKLWLVRLLLRRFSFVEKRASSKGIATPARTQLQRNGSQ
jgi:hypothetical protein